MTTSPVRFAVVKRNEADQNLLVGFDVAAAAVTSPVLITQNIAYNNGPLGVVNYIGVNPAVIVTATTTTLPGTGVEFKNIDISP